MTMYDRETGKRKASYGLAITISVMAVAIAFFAAVIFGVIGAYQPFKVWKAGYHVQEQKLMGQAQFVRAEQNRRILVEQARAEKDAATLRAEAIEIVGQAAKDFPEYRYQEFLGAFGEALQSNAVDKIIFVPTEANIPITEAGRTLQ